MTRNNLWSVEYRKYSHAIALGINVDGKLKWDNSIDMHGLESTSKRQQVYSNSSEDEVLLYYLDGHTISYKPIDGGKDLADQNVFPIDSQSLEVSNSNMESQGSILPWYRDKFITFGSHRLKAQEGETDYFFFLDKISISPNLKSVDP